MNKDTEKCLTLVYEIEGLLHLIEHRGLDNLPDSVKALLSSKSHDLARMLSFGIDSDVQEEVESFEQVGDGIIQETAGNDMETNPEGHEHLEDVPAVNGEDKEASNEVKNETEDDERLAETVEYEQEEDSQPDAGAPDEQLTHLDEAQAEEDEADTEAEEADNARHKYYGDIADKRESGSRLLKLFTLNDRYRFTRELFGNSATAFDVILQEISTLSTLDEAKAYLEERQGVNTSSGTGKEFVDVLRRFYI